MSCPESSTFNNGQTIGAWQCSDDGQTSMQKRGRKTKVGQVHEVTD